MRRSLARGAPAPALPAAGALAAGILLGAHLPVAPPPALGGGLLVAAALAAALGVVRMRPRLAAVGGAVLLACAGFARARPPLRDARAANLALAGQAAEADVFEVTGRIAGLWSRHGSLHGARLDVVEAKRNGRPTPLSGEVGLGVAGESDPAGVAGTGDLVTVRGPLRAPDGVDPMPYPLALPPQVRVVLKSAAQIDRLDGPRGPLGPLVRLHRAVDARMLANAREAGPGEAEALALARALLLGETSGLSGETVSAFRDGGVAHVLSISGFHVALLASLALGAARRTRLSLRATDVALLVATGAYAAFAGGRAPVVRAALMIGTYLVSRLAGRPTSAGQIVGLSALVLLAADPGNLFDAGFLLTYAAVGGIASFGVPLAHRLAAAGAPRPLSDAVGATLGAELAIFPLQAALFHVVPFVAIASNVVVVPLLALFLVLALAAMPLLLASPLLAGAALVPLSAVARLSVGLLHLLDRLAAFRFIPTPGHVEVTLLGALLVLAASLRLPGPRRAALAGAVAVAFLVTARPSATASPGTVELHALDVGQGDSWLLVTPTGRVLVDGGGTFDAAYELGRARLLPRLSALGAVELDAVVLSHPHPDHARGLLAVFDLVPVGLVAVPRGAPRNLFLDEALGAASHRSLPVAALGAGETFEAAGLSFEVLHPGPESYPRSPENNGSLVLKVRAGGSTLLLTGDVEAMAERDLLARGADLSAVVLKVPHHGSRTSTTPAFLAAVSPRVGLIGVGRRNRFGHPGAEVVERLRRARVRVFRTDQDGDRSLLLSAGRVLPYQTFLEGPPR